MKKPILALVGLAFITAPIQVAKADVTYPASGYMDGKQLASITFNDNGTITWNFKDGTYFTQAVSPTVYVMMLYRYSTRNLPDE